MVSRALFLFQLMHSLCLCLGCNGRGGMLLCESVGGGVDENTPSIS
jgi:hypothetical protein